ncbi:hypothetical protein X943_004043 [Babesia divergens]|uniref:t-SNARE coiled-coil homology domain-containing protein n=1 Tax=Babesia divergens TaxID=32595 RepID=A0AAD9LEP3_BABDI|nr:hypothetical protein X943_004043 [Babesia divergens]
MDRSFDFKRCTLYWQSALKQNISDKESSSSDHNVVDRFSVISSSVFAQLQLLDSLLSPYSILSPTNSSGKEPIGGTVQMPCVKNLMSYIHSKRALFHQTDIKDIVHDARIAGELISQMKCGTENQPNKHKGTVVSRHLHEHRLGVIACLQHVLKSVQTAVEDYERSKLNVETSLTAALSLMKENQIKSCMQVKNEESEHAMNNGTIAKEYLNLFVSDVSTSKNKVETTSTSGNEPTSGTSTPRASSGVDPMATLYGPNKSQHQQSYKGLHNLDHFEAPHDEDLQILEQEHKALVTRVQESMQMSELNTINNVQQRLSEISSMFEQFSGTLAVQLDMFESINANVMESLSNIETTEDTLQKANTENIPYHQLLMCYAFVGCGVFLLLVDYLKSHRGSYIF